MLGTGLDLFALRSRSNVETYKEGTCSPSWDCQMSCGKEPECLLAHKTTWSLAWTTSVQQYMLYELHTVAVSKLTSECALKCAYSPGPPFSQEKEDSLYHLTAPCQSAWAPSPWEPVTQQSWVKGGYLGLMCDEVWLLSWGRGIATSPCTWLCLWRAGGRSRLCGCKIGCCWPQSVLVVVLGRHQLGVELRVALSGTLYLKGSSCVNANLLSVRPWSLVVRAQSSLASHLGWNGCSSMMFLFWEEGGAFFCSLLSLRRLVWAKVPKHRIYVWLELYDYKPKVLSNWKKCLKCILAWLWKETQRCQCFRLFYLLRA